MSRIDTLKRALIIDGIDFQVDKETIVIKKSIYILFIQQESDDWFYCYTIHKRTGSYKRSDGKRRNERKYLYLDSVMRYIYRY
ncbi:hypothetical protein DH09_01235 (plasmid) [Bacillaceae bacterium JMAK1]|nr:hypothetical protein DH09_01235 [Bacillaceae bacterium JMAK1]